MTKQINEYWPKINICFTTRKSCNALGFGARGVKSMLLIQTFTHVLGSIFSLFVNIGLVEMRRSQKLLWVKVPFLLLPEEINSLKKKLGVIIQINVFSTG